MGRIVLGIKGSSSSGNRAHAGRPGMVGGSRPRNYGVAITAYTALTGLQGIIPHPDNLNRQGLQAIIDYNDGKISLAQAQAIANSPTSLRGATPAATPAPAPTPAVPAVPVTTADPKLQQDAMDAFNSWPYKYRKQFPVDINSLNDKGLQAVLDMQAKKITPADMYKIVNDPSAHKTGVVTPPPWQKPAAATAPTPPPAPPKPTGPTQAEVDNAKNQLTTLQSDKNAAYWAKNVDPANLTHDQMRALQAYNDGKMSAAELKAALGHQNTWDPRFYQGDVAGKSAKELFDGSSKEVQALALKTGIVATDAATLEYLNNNMSKFGKSAKYPSIYENYLSSTPPNAKDQAQAAIKTVTDPNVTYVSNYDNPFARVSSLQGITGLSAKEQAVIDKATRIRVEAGNVYSNTYNNLGMQRNAYSLAESARTKHFQSSWSGLTADEQKTMTDLMQRSHVMNWVNGNVYYTMPGSTKNTPSKNWKPVTIDKVPSHVESEDQVKRFGYDYRGTLMTKKQPEVAGAYKPDQVLGISSLSKARDQQVRDQFDNSWDHVQHTFSGSVTAAFKIHPQPQVTAKYEAIAKSRDNVQEDMYHGTHYEAAVSIASNGYIVFPSSKAKAGRAMGDGIYLADRSSKSAQYIYSSSGWGTGRSGVLFLNKASKGKQGDYGRNSYGFSSSNAAYDPNINTVFGARGSAWKNNEWCVKDAGAVLPDIWLDIVTR